MDIFSIIMTVFSAIMGAVGIGTSAKANKENLENQQQMLQQQQQFNREAAAAANQETRAQYKDLYSPGALVEQYEEAGLSPSIMYGNGAGVIGASTAAKADSTNLSAPTMQPTVANNFNQITEMMKNMRESEREKSEKQKTEQSILNLQNEIDLNNATIKETFSKISLNNSTEKLNEARTKLEELNQTGKQIDNEVQQATKEDRIKIVSQGLANMKEEYNKLLEQIKQLNIDNETRGKMNNAIINNYYASTALMWEEKSKVYCEEWLTVADIYLKGSQTELNWKEATKIDNDINYTKKLMSQIDANISYLESLKGKTDEETNLIRLKKTSEVIGWLEQLANIQNTLADTSVKGVQFTKGLASLAGSAM